MRVALRSSESPDIDQRVTADRREIHDGLGDSASVIAAVVAIVAVAAGA